MTTGNLSLGEVFSALGRMNTIRMALAIASMASNWKVGWLEFNGVEEG